MFMLALLKSTHILLLIVCSNSRYFNVIGSDPEGRLGEAPRPELREHGRISGACFDAARGITEGLKVNFFWSHLDLMFKNLLHCTVI